MGWVERDFKAHLIPPPCRAQGHLALDQELNHEGWGEEGDYVPFQSQTGGPAVMEVKTPPPSPLELIIPVIFKQHSLQKVGRTTEEKIKLIYTLNQKQAVQNTQI